jgi:NAD(P)H-quinone oxidoreductase subunit 5
MNYSSAYQVLGAVVIACPLLLVVVLGITSLRENTLSERTISRITQGLLSCALVAAVVVLMLMLTHGERAVSLRPWNWVSVGDHSAASGKSPGGGHLPTTGSEPAVHTHFHFEVKFVFDRLSVPFVLLTLALCSTIGAFARSYLHHEPGYRRFFVLFSIFLLGMVVSGLAGSIETLFAGWELVGLSSALLVAFYQERSGPTQNGLRVWGVYRIADAAFLVAAIALHNLTGEGDFAGLMGAGAWPEGAAGITSQQALLVGSLLLIAVAGKSALIPFSGWLPRAMEGPTPSSAIFYGALSVHLGVFLLLRISPILDLSPLLSGLVVALGLSTAALAALAARVQTDIKSSLSFASLTQVGLIVAEVGFGFRYVALTHLLGHACLRTLQLVRAPSLLLDYQRLENAVGASQSRQDDRVQPRREFTRLYRLGFQRGFLDHWLDAGVIRPFLGAFRTCNRWERAWTDWLAGNGTLQTISEGNSQAAGGVPAVASTGEMLTTAKPNGSAQP